MYSHTLCHSKENQLIEDAAKEDLEKGQKEEGENEKGDITLERVEESKDDTDSKVTDDADEKDAKSEVMSDDCSVTLTFIFYRALNSCMIFKLVPF